jgi:copper chaperone
MLNTLYSTNYQQSSHADPQGELSLCTARQNLRIDIPPYPIYTNPDFPLTTSVEGSMRDLTLHIDGMSCGHCLNAVNKALAGLPGVEAISVRIGRADLRYDEEQSDPARIAQAVSAAGYRATPSAAP